MNSGSYHFKKPLNTMEEKKNEYDISLPTYHENGEVHACGAINFENGITIWFSENHKMKTLEEAESVARGITSYADLIDACQAILNPDKIHPEIAKEMVRIAVGKATKK